ncbi:hypothetical protein Ct9H90mP29_14110 [bacterium]|nr:MAG: hypothetical protein Ct9H90mP29_14110 [bacterium]
MGGVINIVTRSGGNLNKWYPELRFGSYGSEALSLSYIGNIKKTNFIISLGYGSSNGQDLILATSRQDYHLRSINR